MKTKELTDLGLTDEQAAGVLKINGLDIEASKAQVATLTGERDSLQSQLTQAQETLSKFREIGADPEKVSALIKQYKDDAENIRAEYERKETKRAQTDWLNAKMDSYGVKSPYARKQLISDIMREPNEGGLPWKPGKKDGESKFAGFDEFMADAKKQDNSLYLTAEEQAAADAAAKSGGSETTQTETAKNPPLFTGAVGNPPDGGRSYVPPRIF